MLGGDSNEVPSSADRNASGSTIGFDFVPPIVADGVSHVVVIRTNASNFTTGSFSIFGPGGSTTVDAYQPSAAVPEPASLLLLGTGVIALRRRFGRR